MTRRRVVGEFNGARPDLHSDFEAKATRLLSAWNAGDLGLGEIAESFKVDKVLLRELVEAALADGRTSRVPRRVGVRSCPRSGRA